MRIVGVSVRRSRSGELGRSAHPHWRRPHKYTRILKGTGTYYYYYYHYHYYYYYSTSTATTTTTIGLGIVMKGCSAIRKRSPMVIGWLYGLA